MTDEPLDPEETAAEDRPPPGDPPFDPMGDALDRPVRAAAEDSRDVDSESVDLRCAWYPTNDLGNARRYIARHGFDLIYVPEQGEHVWDGARWNRDRGRYLAQSRAQATVDAMRHEVAALERSTDPDDKGRAATIRTHRHDSGSSGRISAMMREAWPHLLRGGEEMDARPFLVSCANGTVELGLRAEMRSHRREDLLTRAAAARYDEAAVSPAFENFVRTVLPDDDVRAFVQRWFGYCLTGDTAEQVLVMFLGEGSNGKSTLLRLIAGVMADLHATVDISTFKHDPRRGGSDASPDIARLPGARMVTATEPEIGYVLSEARVKLLSGGEKVAARHLNKDIFEFEPRCKITLAFNNLPKIRGQDYGTRRRFLLVRFTERVGPAEVKPALEAFEAERDGIFRWLLDGAEMWFESGLAPPPAVQDATADFMAQQGGLQQFIADCCAVTDLAQTTSPPRTRIKLLYEAWKGWCREQGEDPGTSNLLGRRLTEAGFVREKSGDVYYKGIELTETGRAFADGRSSSDPPPHDGYGGP